jgi:hypothetical protein
MFYARSDLPPPLTDSDGEHRARRLQDHILGRRSKQQLAQFGSAPDADNDFIDLMPARILNQILTGRIIRLQEAGDAVNTRGVAEIPSFFKVMFCLVEGVFGHILSGLHAGHQMKPGLE